MCGFAGLIDSSATELEALCDGVRVMNEAIRHRGPDDAGLWVDEASRVALGFRRLAILDLTDSGHQPMLSHDGQLVLVFNGEIYNHLDLRSRLSAEGAVAWTGHSDTETLLACFGAWGVRETLERTVGMFALALWDRGNRRLHLARDRFGEKPLYYGWTTRGFVFGSELQALKLAAGFDNAIDRDVLSLYTQFSYVPAPYSIYRNIYKLQSGCVLSMSPADASSAPSKALFAPARHQGIAVERYWSLDEVVERGLAHPLVDAGDATDRLAAALGDAVRLQSIADVPLGAFLSGGLDSSTIVALMQAQSSRQVRTFTIGFDEAGFNEAEQAKAVARHLGTDHTELYVSPQQALDVIPRLPYLYSEPFADPSQIPTHLVSHISRRHVTVALSGDGGDELFGGYSRYLWAPRVARQLRWMPDPARHALSAAIRGVSIATWDRLGNGPFRGLGISRLGDKAHKLARRLEHAGDIDALYRMLVTTWPGDTGLVPGARPLPTRLDRPSGKEPLNAEHRMMFWDALTYLPDDILHKVDRASMGVSLETRAPFLDHRVAELAWRLPLDMKIRGGQGKWIVRQVLHRYVPQHLIERPKMGFGVPIDSWLRGPLREWADDLLSESTLAADGFFNRAVVRQKWDEHVSGTRNWSNEIWCVLMFQAWLRTTPDAASQLQSPPERRVESAAPVKGR